MRGWTRGAFDESCINNKRVIHHIIMHVGLHADDHDDGHMHAQRRLMAVHLDLVSHFFNFRTKWYRQLLDRSWV